MQTNLLLPAITTRQLLRSLMMIGTMLILTSSARAEDANAEKPLTLKVTKVETDSSKKVALFHDINIKIDNLKEWVAQPNHDAAKFILYIDGQAFNGLTPKLDDDNTSLKYRLLRTDENKDAWKTLLSSKRSNLYGLGVPVTVRQEGVNVEGQDEVVLTVLDPFWFKIFVVSFLAAIALFWCLAYLSDILREPGPQPQELDAKGKTKRKPYSLARTQMAFWFFIVIISYVFIWMVTSDPNTLTASVLGLIGISAATGLGAAIVDSSKRDELENQRRVLETTNRNDEVEIEKLQTEIASLKTAVAATPAPDNLEEQKTLLAAKQAELAAKQLEVTQAAEKIQRIKDATKPMPSKRFIDDILSDCDGISFHRFQIFAWTIVLIVIFVASVYNLLTMPDFDATLLGLMGISGGTYIGFKLPSQQG